MGGGRIKEIHGHVGNQPSPLHPPLFRRRFKLSLLRSRLRVSSGAKTNER